MSPYQGLLAKYHFSGASALTRVTQERHAQSLIRLHHGVCLRSHFTMVSISRKVKSENKWYYFTATVAFINDCVLDCKTLFTELNQNPRPISYRMSEI